MPKIADEPKVTTKKNTNGKKPKGTTASGNPAKKTAPKKTVEKALIQGADRPVIYPEYEARIYAKGSSEGPMTVELMKQFLGWEEETDKVKFGDVYHLVDNNEKKIRLHNNPRNRPFDKAWSKTLEGAVLRREWKVNGETMIIGKTGISLAMQHRGVALILAGQEWAKNPELWPKWDEEPYLETFMTLGIDEDDETVNTIDTGKPRSLSDVIFRSEYFSDLGSDDREECSKIATIALKTFAHRTGAWLNAFAPKRTHPEMLDLLDRHKGMLECVRFVWKEDKGKKADEPKLKDYINSGYAAGLMLLMGCSASSAEQIEAYRSADVPNEDALDWSMKEKAEDFWVSLAGRDSTFKEVEKARKKMVAQSNDNVRANEQMALLCKAWASFAKGDTLTEKLVWPEYVQDEDDPSLYVLNECPTVGGIDRGEPEDDEDLTTDSEEEVEERKVEERTKKENGETPKKPAKEKKSKKVPEIGSTIYVEEDGGMITGKLLEIYDGSNGKVVSYEAEDGKKWETSLKNVHTEPF